MRRALARSTAWLHRWGRRGLSPRRGLSLRRGRTLVGLLALALLLAGGWRGFRALAGEPTARLRDDWFEGHEVVARDGVTLRELPSAAGSRGRALPLDRMGGRLLLATIVSEDKRFFDHAGVDVLAIARAVGQNAAEVRLVSGASTITQQLVKLLDHRGQPRPRALGEKLWEAARALNLEENLDKSQILEAYVNRLGYGHGLVGPDAAARAYFAAAPNELSWAQATTLAVLPRAPSFLDLYRHPERVVLRQRALLEAMMAQGVLPEADFARAIAERVVPRSLDRAWVAPHLVEMLRAEGRLSAGPVTRTTIDSALQREVQGFVRSHLESLARRAARNAAVVVLDNASGEVLAYVGNGDFAAPDRAGQVDHASARRQPGSTLKPFVYALAFEGGREAAELAADVPTRFGRGAGAYAPENFDGQFRGPISLREALAGSLNVPAVRLAADLPPGALLDLLRGLGVGSLDRAYQHYGLSLALGSGEVTLRELAGAYAALARAGHGVELRYVVSDAGPLGAAQGGESRIDSGVAALVSESLSDPLARVRGLGGRGPFDFGYPVAVKTGTSSGFRDGWCVGYSRERTVAVWVGNADGRPTAELSGAEGAGALFVDVMRRVMGDVGSRAPLWDPELLQSRLVCPLSGRPVGPACPEAVRRSFVARRGEAPPAEPEPCPLHRHGVRTDGPAPWQCDDHGPATLVLLPEPFADWLAAQPLGAPGRDPAGAPWLLGSAVPGCSAQPSRVVLRVEEPSDGSVLLLSRTAGAGLTQPVAVRAKVGSGNAAEVGELEFLLDGKLAARASAPFQVSVAVGRGDHELTVRPVDARRAVVVGVSRFSVR